MMGWEGRNDQFYPRSLGSPDFQFLAIEIMQGMFSFSCIGLELNQTLAAHTYMFCAINAPANISIPKPLLNHYSAENSKNLDTSIPCSWKDSQ